MNDAVWSAMCETIDRFAEEDEGRSVYVEILEHPEANHGVRADREMPGASVLKLPLNAAVWEKVSEGELDPNRRIPAGEIHRTEYPSLSRVVREEGEDVSLRFVSVMSLITSDNPASDYLLDLVGFDAVNRRAELDGAHDTRMRVDFADENLGDDARRNRTTARDALRLLRPYLEEPYLESPRRALINNLRNNRIPLRLPEDVPVLHKTGTLDGVANDVGIISGSDGRLGVSVFTDGQPDTAYAGLQIGDLARSLWILSRKL